MPSLRNYVAELDELEDIERVERLVDWDLELGALIRRTYDERSPAPLFTSIKGDRIGGRVLGAPAAISSVPGHPLARVGLSLGLGAAASGRDIIEFLSRAPSVARLPPVTVSAAPCQEHVAEGDQVDLFALPTPRISPYDGGRYLNTFGLVIVRTPDGRWTNWSVSRQMVVDRYTLSGLVASHQHLGMILQEWRQVGRPMPFATAIGVDPLLPFLAGMPLAADVDEVAVAGGLRGSPVELVPCRTVPLEVPADAEIVVEGEVSLDQFATEGPMADYTGYAPRGAPDPAPAFAVTALTRRSDPILPVVASGRPVEENHTVWGVAMAAQALSDLRAAGLPIASCWTVLESACHWLVVSAGANWREHFADSQDQFVRAVGEVAFGSRAGFNLPRVILVDDDIDITDLSQVVWAFATRCAPVRDEHPFAQEPTLSLPIFLGEADRRSGRADKVVYDCLLPEPAATHLTPSAPEEAATHD